MTDDDKLDPVDITQRRDRAIFRALNTPPSPTKDIKGKPRTTKAAPAKTASSRSKPKAPEAD